MRRTFLALSFLALVLVIILVANAGLGLAQGGQAVPNARPTPTAIPLPSEHAPAAPESPEIPALPDLVVTSIQVVPTTPRLGEPVMIRVTITNQGTAEVPLVPTPNNFWSDLYIDPAEVPIQLGQLGVYQWGCQAAWLPAGASYVLETTYTFDDVKTYSLWAQVDTDNHVQEANENNNVLGPISVEVLAQDVILHETHQDFQLGMASSLDLSHPEGVMRLGIFDEPTSEPAVYEPDTQINDPTALPSGPTSVNQTRPALASDGAGTLFAIWEDGRNGGVYNRDIYFSRSTDGGDTWQRPDVRVNDGTSTGNQIRPDLVYDQSIGRLYAVWQDERNGNYDIYFAYSDDFGDTWIAHQKLNDDVGTAAQLNPSIAVGPGALGPGDRVYVVWQDQRNGNDDVYLIRSDDGGASWSPNYFVTDDPSMTAQNQAAPSVAVENVRGYVVVAWEDWRDPLHPEIYAMWSIDEGETYGIDVPVTIVAPEARDTYRRAPVLATQTTTETIEYWDEVDEITKTVTTGVTAIHVAWEDGPPDETDVYYAYAYYTFEAVAREECPYPYQDAFCFQAPQKINGTVIDSDYVRPPGSPPVWPIEPSWQGQVSMDLVPEDSHWTGCHAGSTQVYSRGVVLAWSDARSFDEWRYEIHTRRIASPEGDPKSFEPCEDWAWGMVNDNTKLYPLRDDPEEYKIYQPAATGQFRPAVLVDPTRVFVAWDDDRYDDPTVAGTVRNRDVFMAEMVRGLNTEGIFISPVFDGGGDNPKWYVLSWWAVTELGGDVRLQTRFGVDPYPPQDPDATVTWTAWTGNPGTPVTGCPGDGNGITDCYYDAPGRHIVDPDGNDWFGCSGATCPGPYRYMQYKVIITGPSRRTALSRVVVHYQRPPILYLPLIFRSYP
jgi:hypothetical protein